MGRIILATPEAIFSRRKGVKLDRIVVHTMEGTLPGTVAWFGMTKEQRARAALGRDPTPEEIAAQVPTAAHYLIGADGSIVQMVPDDKKALHAGGFNDRSIGIELEGYAAKSVGFSDRMLSPAAKVTAILCRKYGIPLDRDHVVGHSEVPGATHTDPGAGFAWLRFMELARGFTPAP
jgi:hypothetical protein